MSQQDTHVGMRRMRNFKIALKNDGKCLSKFV